MMISSHHRIKYIVLADPKAARRLVYTEGYHPPKRLDELIGAVKQLAGRGGGRFAKKLLALHPDRQLLLSIRPKKIAKPKCSSCASTETQEVELRPQEKHPRALASESKDHLEALSGTDSENVQGSSTDWRIQQIEQWIAGVDKKGAGSVDVGTSFSPMLKREVLITLGLCLLTGILLGSTFKSVSYG